MRQKRAKAYRKLMSLYAMSFGFRQPYQVLGTPSSDTQYPTLAHYALSVDSHMCKDAIAHKIDLVKQLGVALQRNVKNSEHTLDNVPRKYMLQNC